MSDIDKIRDLLDSIEYDNSILEERIDKLEKTIAEKDDEINDLKYQLDHNE